VTLVPLHDPLRLATYTPIATANVIVFKEGDYAVAVDGKTKEVIARGTDHASVIQQAINHVHNKGGGIVFIKSGIYILNNYIIIRSNVWLVGSGESTVLKRSATATFTLAMIYNENFGQANGVENVAIMSLVLDGNKDENTTGIHGIQIYGGKRITIRDVIVRNTTLEGIIIGGGDSDYLTEQAIIENCKVENLIDKDLFHVRNAKNVLVYGNVGIGPGDFGVEVEYSTQVAVENNIFLDVGSETTSTFGGGVLVKASNNVVVRGNIIYPNSLGIEAYTISGREGEIYDIVIEGNMLIGKSTSSIGIFLQNGAERCIVKSNKVYGFQQVGILLTVGDLNIPCKYCIVEGNIVANCGYDGIRLAAPHLNLIIGNICMNNGQAGVDYAGIAIYGYSYQYAKYNFIIGNVCIDVQATKTQSYGILEKADDPSYVVENIIAYNHVRGNSTAQISYLSAKVKHNEGYATENSGVATITAGATSVTVSHGLALAPSKVLITPLGQPAGKLWVENITSTSFDIKTDTAPSADLNVAWYAEV